MVSDRGVMIETTNGRKEITPDSLKSAADVLNPNFVISLSDEVSSFQA